MKVYPDVGAAYADLTYAIGTVLTQWQPIETKLYQLFIFLCGASDEAALNVIFHEMSLDLKIRTITALVALRDSSRLADWDEVSKSLFKQKRIRDKVAHWAVLGAPNPDGDGYISYLVPPTSDHKVRPYVENPKGGGMDAENLRTKAIKDFAPVLAAIHNFMVSFPRTA